MIVKVINDSNNDNSNSNDSSNDNSNSNDSSISNSNNKHDFNNLKNDDNNHVSYLYIPLCRKERYPNIWEGAT